MLNRWSLSYSVTLLSIFLHKAASIELEPIPPTIGSADGHVGKRALSSALELQNAETFLWGSNAGPAQSVMANFTMYTPGDAENVISMEKFSGMLKSVACTNTSIILGFNDKLDLKYAESSWNWVNKAESHAFVMVAGAHDCHWNAHRQPFNVTNVAYDDATATASLNAVPLDWKTIAHSYDLSVGHMPTSESQMQSRGLEDFSYDKTGSFDLTHAIPSKPVSITANNLTTTIECTECNSTGKINWEFKLSVHLLDPKEASLKLTPAGVGATATLKLTESGTLTKPIQTSTPILSIPIDGVKIGGGLLSFGPSLDFSVGANLDAVKGSASITGGGSLTIPDSAVMEVDLLSSSKNTFSNWKPTIQTIPVELDAQIEATLEVYIQSALNVDLKALHFGYGVGLDLQMPNFKATLAADASTTGACGTKSLFGVQANATVGAALSVEVTDGHDVALWDHELASFDYPLAGKCFPFGPSASTSSISTTTSTTLSSSIPTTTATTAASASITTASGILPTGGYPMPSSTSTTNGTTQYIPRAIRRGDANDAKLIAGVSRHLRSHRFGKH